MSSAISIDMLKGALAAHGQRVDGGATHEKLRAQLGEFLVSKMFNVTSEPAAVPKLHKESAAKRPLNDQAPAGQKENKKPRRKSKYHAFLQRETPLIRSGRPDLKGHEVLREAVRRWRIVQSNESNSGSPPMITCTDGASSDDNSSESADGLTSALMELPPAEVNQGLEAAGLAVEPGNPAGNASRLAFQMLEID